MLRDPPGRTAVRASLPAVVGGAVALALAAAPAPSEAQHEDPPESAAHVLEDVTVVGADGSRRAGVSLVVRDGLVEALGPDVTPPADAERLEGDSLYVYPGLVDADGGTELTWPGDGEDDEDDGTTAPWNPGRTAQGFTPARRAADALTATGEGLEQLRDAGVVASAVHPDDGLAPGRGALLSHRPGAEVPRELVVDPDLGLSLAFETADQAYPSTHYGVLAFLRQSLADADRHRRVLAAHGEDASGMATPAWDPDLEALTAAVSGPDPVFFRADGAEDVRQALDLSEAHGFRPVIVGGRDAWEVADRLATRDVPVLLSLDFPEPQRWEPPEDDAGEEPAEGDEPSESPPDAGTEGGDAAAERQQQEEELEPEVLREKRRIEDAWAAAGRLVEAGVPVALTSGGGEADLREGARKAIEYGLSEEDALRAVTATPARVLGAPWIAEVREGRPANLVVTDGPLFEEGTRVRYTFVEGGLERGTEPGAEPDEPPAVDVSGQWEMELESGSGSSFGGTLSLDQQGAGFDGTMSTQLGESPVVDGVVSGNDVSFTVEVDAGGQTLRLSFSGTASEDEMSGSGSGPPQMGSFSWEADRTGGPDGGER